MEDIDVQFLVFYFEDEIFIFIIFGSIGKFKMVFYFYFDVNNIDFFEKEFIVEFI